VFVAGWLVEGLFRACSLLVRKVWDRGAEASREEVGVRRGSALQGWVLAEGAVVSW
jgi:hypothetical protein